MSPAASILIPCTHLAATLDFLAPLGFRVESIMPADAPSLAVVSGHGVRLRLQEGGGAVVPFTLHLSVPAVSDLPAVPVLTGPDGLRVVYALAAPPLVLPPAVQAFSLVRAQEVAWHAGRAGMAYRDLLPGRWGGRFIASHIRIISAGPVPDYVHFHRIRFQMIYCRRGWVRVVYEDQGAPFTLHAGDCVLQAPEIRHRVLESSAGLEVIEIGCPAEHETCADWDLALPNAEANPTREFGGQVDAEHGGLRGGQRFVRHVAQGCAPVAWACWPGAAVKDFGFVEATHGLARAGVVTLTAGYDGVVEPRGEFRFLFVLSGEVALVGQSFGAHRVGAGDAVAIPEGGSVGVSSAVGAEVLDVWVLGEGELIPSDQAASVAIA